MKFFKEKILKRIHKITPRGWVGLGILILALLIVPQTTHAWFGIDSFAYKAVGTLFLGIAWLISALMGVVVGFEGWLIEILLNLNSQIVNSPPVHFGFPVALSIANLGFTAAIIVIAIATILRWSGYGIKQILWKLVVAALLVNFSLVFAGAIINFADQLTLYFLNQVSPAGSGSSLSSFADALAGDAFNPQKSFLTPTDKTLSPSEIETIAGTAEPPSVGSKGAELGKMLLPIISLVFTVFSLAAIIITLAVFIFMLLYRYVALGILLIIMPFAWLLWIFPGLSSNWSKWWSQFLKQVFFAPLVVFFLYLAILTSHAIQKGGSLDLASFSSSGSRSGISKFLGDLLSVPVQGLMNTIIIVGITLGGLYVANQLSIVGAKAGMGAFQKFGNKIGNKIGGVAKDRAKRVGGWGLKKTGVEGGAKTLAEKAHGNAILRTLGVSKMLGAGATGLTRARVATEEGMVKEKEKEMAGNATDVLKTMHLTAAGATKIAIENELRKRKELGDLSINSTITDKNKALYERFGQKKAFEDLEKATMINVKMANLQRRGFSQKEMDGAAIEFYKAFEKKDAAFMHANDIFSGEAKMGLNKDALKAMSESIACGLATSTSALTPNILSRAKGDTIENFEPVYNNAITREETRTARKLDGTDLETEYPPLGKEMDEFVASMKRRAESLKKARVNFERSMARNATGLGETGGGGSSTGGGTT